jgi:hypothetical protein
MSDLEIESWQERRFNGDPDAAVALSVEVTRPALIDPNYAVIGVSYWGGGLYGGGSLFVLKKSSSGWRAVGEIPLWAS